jgi:hypothetical protein
LDHDENPYASPKADTSDPDHVESEVERIRRQYIGHETAVRSISSVFYLAGLAWTIHLLVWSFDVLRSGPSYRVVDGVVVLLLIGLAAGAFWLGYGVMRLRQIVLLPVGFITTVALLVVPFVSVLILHLVFRQNGRFVFSPEYQEIIRGTPSVQYRTSVVVWTLLCVLLAILACGFYGGLLASVFGKL